MPNQSPYYIVRTHASSGAATLARLLGCKRNLLGAPRVFVPSNKTVINWGSSKDFPVPTGTKVLNKPEAVALAVDKRITFEILNLEGVSIPTYFTNNRDAEQYANDYDATLVARSTATGHSGRGITIVRPGEPIPANTVLITQFIKKKAEYRFHVVNGEIILEAQKRKRNDFEQTGDQHMIRSYDNGWIFAINNIEGIEDVYREEAILAVQALGLDFGAVDYMVDHEGRGYVLEVNTAPAIEGESTKQAYQRAFERMVA